ncbi:hypothetical protein ACFQX7_08995 [Luedemannella flava]
MSSANSTEKQIIVFGEDDNDRQSIKVLLCGLRPDISPSAVKLLREPMALVKDISPGKVGRKVDRVAAALRAAHARQEIRCVLMHEDADALEPAHVAIAERIENSYAAMPWKVHAVVPAWEMEAWWFLFPDAVAALRSSWRKPDDYLNKDVGKVANAKEKLKSAVRPAGFRGSLSGATQRRTVWILRRRSSLCSSIRNPGQREVIAGSGSFE